MCCAFVYCAAVASPALTVPGRPAQQTNRIEITSSKTDSKHKSTKHTCSRTRRRRSKARVRQKLQLLGCALDSITQRHAKLRFGVCCHNCNKQHQTSDNERTQRKQQEQHSVLAAPGCCREVLLSVEDGDGMAPRRGFLSPLPLSSSLDFAVE